MSIVRRLMRRASGSFRAESGSATIEFVILFPMFVLIFLSMFELSVLMARQTLLDRALDLSVRSLRLGTIEPLTHATLKSDVCARARYLSSCEERLHLNLRPVSTQSWDIGTAAPGCTERSTAMAPVTEFTPGGENELMMVSACVFVDPFFPTSGLALHLPLSAEGRFGMVSVSAFVNEPAWEEAT